MTLGVQTHPSSTGFPPAKPGPAEPSGPAGPRIWAIGGGKGGVGKSVVTVNLALALARRGLRCALVDADLGAANLHTLLGVPSPRWTLSHFLNGEVTDLSEVLCPTLSPNLWLVSGARALLGMANPKHAKKEKLLRHVRGLEVDHVFLDLSAGSAFNVLDFFLAAQRGVLVVVPEPTSIENAYHFLKAAFFRSLSDVARQSEVRAALNCVLETRGKGCVRSPQDLVGGVMEIDRQAGMILQEQAKAFAPMLIVNQARTVAQRALGEEIRLACRHYLGSRLDYLGALERDECVRHAVRQRQPVLELFPGCPFSQDLETVAERLLNADQPGSETSPVDAALECHGSRYGEADLATHGLLGEESSRSALGLSEAPPAPEVPPTAQATLPPPDPSAPGAYLKACREHLGLQLHELSRRTRIRGLASIENERFDQLPPEPYVRGFVAQYARALGIPDAEALAARFLERYRRFTAEQAAPAQPERRSRPPRLLASNSAARLAATVDLAELGV